MNTEGHLTAFEEHKRTIFKWALEIEGLEKSQRVVGIHSSRGIIELLSAYLHKASKVDMGYQLNHRWFKSERVSEKIPDFPNKELIIKGMVKLENLSENLAYGSKKSTEETKEAIRRFTKLENEINKLIENEK